MKSTATRLHPSIIFCPFNPVSMIYFHKSIAFGLLHVLSAECVLHQAVLPVHEGTKAHCLEITLLRTTDGTDGRHCQVGNILRGGAAFAMNSVVDHEKNTNSKPFKEAIDPFESMLVVLRLKHTKAARRA